MSNRQWDTKKEFKPNYKHLARVCFLGIFDACRQPDWRYAFSSLGFALWRMAGHLGNILAAAVILFVSPVLFPVLCLTLGGLNRRARLNYIRRNRAADEDI